MARPRLRAIHVAVALSGCAVFLMLVGILWRWWPYELISSFEIDDPAIATFSPDGSTYITATGGVEYYRDTTGQGWRARGDRGPVRAFDLATGKLRFSILGSADHLATLKHSPDGKWLAVEDQTGKLTVWNAQTGAKHLEAHTSIDRHGRGIAGYNFTFSSDGRNLSCEDRDGKSVTLYDIAEGGAVAKLRDACRPMAFAADGRLLATASPDLTIRLWEIPSGREIAAISGHAYLPNQLAFSGDGKKLLSGLPRYEGPGIRSPVTRELLLWDVEARSLVSKLAPTGFNAWAEIAFSADDKFALLLGSAGQSGAWDLTSTPPRHALEIFPTPPPAGTPRTGGYIDIPKLSPDRRFIAMPAGETGVCSILDTITGQTRSTLRVACEGQWAVGGGFSPDGCYLSIQVIYKGLDEKKLFASWEDLFRRDTYELKDRSFIKLFDVESGQELARQRRPNTGVGSFVCTPEADRCYTWTHEGEREQIGVNPRNWLTVSSWHLPPRRPTVLMLHCAALPALLVTLLLWWRLLR